MEEKCRQQEQLVRQLNMSLQKQNVQESVASQLLLNKIKEVDEKLPEDQLHSAVDYENDHMQDADDVFTLENITDGGIDEVRNVG